MRSKMGPIQMLTLEQELDQHLSSLERKRGQRLSGSPGPRVKRKEQQTGTVLRRAGACVAGAEGRLREERRKIPEWKISCAALPASAPPSANASQLLPEGPLPQTQPHGIKWRPAETVGPGEHGRSTPRALRAAGNGPGNRDFAEQGVKEGEAEEAP